MMTMHGTTMIFFVAMPILAGVANYIVPLQIGARDMAFPRLNALGLWVTLFGGILAYFSFATGGAPAIGWFAYAPLTEHTFARGAATDFWILGLLVSGVGSVSGAINLVTTVLTLRCPGMTLRKIPLYTWMAFWANVQILFAMPPLTAALIMLLFDRNLGAHFFDAQAGGSPLPVAAPVLVLRPSRGVHSVLPAFGMVSDVIPVFSRKVIFGYEFVAASTVAIAFISFGVWAHHMFTVGMSRTVDVFFAAASLRDRHPDRGQDVQLAGHDLRRPHRDGRAHALLPRLPVDVRDRRTDGHHARRGSDRLSAHRQLLRRRPFPLGDHRRHLDGPLRGRLLLVSQGHGPDVFRTAGALALLAVPDRLHPDLRADAHLGHAGDAAPDLHLPGGPRLGSCGTSSPASAH